MRQVQKEEAARARREEEEFMRWWAAEEERIRRETQAKPGPRVSVSASSGAEGAGSGKKGRGGRRKEKERISSGGDPGGWAGASTDQAQAHNEHPRERVHDGQRASRARRPRGAKNPHHPANAQAQQV